MPWNGPYRFADNDRVGNDIPGVYVIARVVPGYMPQAVYVGQGASIRQRIGDHIRTSRPGVGLGGFLAAYMATTARFYYLRVGDEDTRNNCEHTLFWHYGGTKNLYNQVEPPGRLIRMDFPF